MAVPLLDLNAQNLAIEEELKAAFDKVLHSGQFILGAEVEAFETKIAEMVDVRHAIGVSSGTDAILLALMTLGIGPGDEVLCPSFTFFATAGCIARTGAKPVFVDSCPVCFNLDVADAARKITPQTKAIIPVHLFGQAAEMDGVMALARRENLAVIEDAAQALGASNKGRKVGSLGTFGTFSFFPSKNLGGFGDAGMLVTNDAELAQKARLLRTHGAQPKYYHKYVGANFRLDALQAALLSVKLPLCQAYTARRRSNASYYTDKLKQLPGVTVSGTSESTCWMEMQKARPIPVQNSQSNVRLFLPLAYPYNDHIWNQYTVRVTGNGQRDALKAFLTERGIGTEIYYPVPMHQQECFAYLTTDSNLLPNATMSAKECLSLPIYPELEAEQTAEVAGAIGEFLSRPGSGI
ncbi:MAG: DegT/DnrJ/EryC1/StrS family aminotransferase [Verrucomicrobiota bacterium]